VDILNLLTEFGLPVFLVLIVGGALLKSFKSQMDFIQKDMTSEVEDLKHIIIKLIDNAKKNELSLEQVKGRLTTIVNIFKEKK
tara:strand:- start:168 stop:416 length:249 start_codon:yes stop_codon:yes gene_type:complete